jgi:hypothetical protein
VQRHQGPGIVEQHLLGHAAEMPERRLDPVEPGRLPLVAERLDEGAPRIPERRHEEVDPNPLSPDRYPRLAEIDLQLPARRRLEAQRRPRLGHELPPVGPDRPLHRAQADGDPVLALEVLAHDVSIAAVPVEPLPQPGLEPVQLARPPRRRERPPAARGHVALHRRAAAPELVRQTASSPSPDDAAASSPPLRPAPA